MHVLGANELGRDGVADGRARTFMPLMRPRGPGTELSLVMPVKGKVRRQTDGSLTDLSAWQHLLGPEGRLTCCDISDEWTAPSGATSQKPLPAAR